MKTAIIDVDGTLLDSGHRHILVLENALKNFNISCDVADFLEYKVKGGSTKKYLRYEKHFEDEVVDKISSWWAEHIEDPEFLEDDRWYDETFDFLSALHADGYEIYILTARKNRDYIINKIKSAIFMEFIKEIYVVNPYNAGQEKAQVIKEILGKTRNQGSGEDDECIVVGDTEADFEAAVAGGVTPYILNRGFRDKDYWDKKQVASYTSLENVLRELKSHK